MGSTHIAGRITARPLGEAILDQHLTVPAGSPDGEELRAASAINQAIGFLIGRGYSRQQADWELDTQAAHAGVDRPAVAHRILAGITTADDEGRFDLH